jgi:Lipocalin-like domain
MRRVFLVVPLLAATGALTGQLWAGFQPQSANGSAVAGRFIGTWRLVSVQTNGKPNPNRGVRPTGLIIYDAGGNMAVQIAPERARPSWPPTGVPTPDQAKEAVTGYTAYFGTYTINEKAGTVTHHRAGALNLYAVDLVRRYEFTPEGHLILVPVDNPVNRLAWERIR